MTKVLPGRELHDGALDLAVRREVGQAARHGQVRPLRLQLCAVDGDGAALAMLRGPDRGQQRLPAGARDAGDPQHVARPDLGSDTPAIGPATRSVTWRIGSPCSECRCSDSAWISSSSLPMRRLIKRASVERAGRLGGHPEPVAEHGDVVGHLEHLVQPVGDVEDADAGLRHPPDDLQQVPDLVLGERGGRLVEHDQPGRVVDVGPQQRPGYRDTGLEGRR